ncbi:MAG: PHP domain-containing protein [Bacillota bacterium]
MKEVDLHIHTTFSDGKLTPYQVIERAYYKDIAAVGITDHDTMRGISQAMEAGRIFGIEVVPGVELSTYYAGKELHILGYYCRAENFLLKKTLAFVRLDRYNRIVKMLALLKKEGIDLDLKDVLALAAGGESLGRPHLAEALCQKGYCQTPVEAFQRFLGDGKPAYVKRLKISSYNAIRLIRRSGGIAVLAHPGLYKKDGLIPLLKLHGLSGIEAFHPDHRSAECRRYCQMGLKYNLLITGGSDFHGQGSGSSAAPGAVVVDYGCLDRLKRAVGNPKC